MKCIDEKYITLPPQDQMRFYNFKEFETIPTLSNYNLVSVGSSLDFFKEYDDIVLFLFEEPNDFWVPGMEKTIKENDSKIKKILSPCPYSVDYFNKLYNTDKRQWVFLPFNIKNIPEETEKIFDVYFTGHVMGQHLINTANLMHNYKHCFVSYNYGPYAGVGYHEKLKLNSKSKISIVHNCLFDSSGFNMDELFPGHEAFKHIQRTRLTPQLKTRTIEASACKSIILSHFEDHRVIETMFKPDFDFIYWYNFKDLEEKINEILSNYEKYTYLAENAYNTLINNWTTYHFFEKYLRNL